MARVSFEKRRALPPVAHPSAVTVRVFSTGTASVDGTPVAAAPGEEIQRVVLDHLQRLAISLGAPVRATVRDDRAGCVVPLEVSADGSSRVTGEPARIPAPQPRTAAVSPGTVRPPTGQFGPAPAMAAPVTDAPAADTRAGGADARAAHPREPAGAAHTRDRTGTARPGHGTARPEAGNARPARTSAPAAAAPPAPVAVPPREASAPAPPRGFDAVAEEVLGDGPLTETAEGAELLAEPMTRISEAVRDGRVDTAAELADRALAEASAVLGPHHTEVLHLRELRAYIAYLAGDPVRAFRLSLDLARLRRTARDGEAAYGNLQSAATAWRAVRDPEEGLRLGRDLIDLWTDLTAEPGPAADDPRPLESARARMVRLTDRAERAARP
ncbi:hypothetical protein [Streptomyces sp. NPDC006193]|uniref:hypothetical protein n=1 Tax=Streptomyces sp. NPDC006193 TaxID=3155717 RepID=UPI0033BE3BBE